MSAELWQQILFWALAVMMILSAIRVVTTRNIVHAALYLVATLMGAAGIYILLFAQFVAWVQVLVYIGAVVVLMLFGLMLTRAPIGKGNYDNDQRWLALVCALSVFGVTTYVLLDAFEGQEISFAGTAGTTTESLGMSIFTAYVLPFEAVSVLLLAALIGAVVISRKDDQPHRRQRVDERAEGSTPESRELEKESVS